ncbi:MAG TPA: SET domain-containing protein [Candidatus Paceibacterota bacterium]
MSDVRFAIKRSRPGTGLGLFARVQIGKGDFIAEYTGTRIPTPDAEELDSRYLFEIDEKWTIEGSSRSNIARYINHSCKPNVEAVIEDGQGGEDHINIYAMRNIGAGEEFTIDYGEEYFDEFIRPRGCRCDRCTVAV